MRALPVLLALVLAVPPAAAHDERDRGRGRRWWDTRTEYTRIRDPEPVRVIVTAPPSAPADSAAPAGPAEWGYVTKNAALKYRANVRNCGNPACSAFQTAAVAVALPIGIALDAPFWVGRALAWPFRRGVRKEP